ncbi:metallophosphoesterase [Roseicyclus sp. F158]|uniref:Metallophosphoesterase n=1 Tax=Tropicimonas omnivorans TaxID=3075590 RepID=A0ABU3DMH1_9RHOB|nr:metallophosphoesterase [Roseicyclus sp. F158]MDT0684719.1 metallophosphoesterase [Roseicyclus sp. F158]
MNVLFFADLHLDLWLGASRDPFAEIPETVWERIDAVVVVGDLTNKPKVRWPHALAHMGKYIALDRVYLLPGNHDYYDHTLDGDDRLAAIATEAGARFVQTAAIEFGGCRLLCATLWTDFELTGPKDEAVRSAMSGAVKRMSDYRYIRLGSDGYRRIRPQDIRRNHMAHRAWLEQKLAEPFEGDTIVATHHAPHPDALEGDFLDVAYASDLSELIERHAPAFWIYGHTHTPAAFTVGRTELVNVSLGYPMEIGEGQCHRAFPERTLRSLGRSRHAARPPQRPIRAIRCQ